MPHERFFVPEIFHEEETLSVVDAEFHHLRHVMRLSAGEMVELVNGQNQCATARLTQVDRHSASAEILSVAENTPGKPLILAQALPRPSRLETVLEKGCELGVTTFWLFPGELSEHKQCSDAQHKRMTTILISAMKQCGRWDLPIVLFKPPLILWDALEGSTFFGDVSPDAPYLKERPQGETTILCIGPEKGFSDKETEHLRKLGARGIRLSPYILRTDTAAIAGLAQVCLHLQ